MNTLKLVIHTGTFVYHLAFLNSVLKLMTKDTWTDELNKEIVLVMKYTNVWGVSDKKKFLQLLQVLHYTYVQVFYKKLIQVGQFIIIQFKWPFIQITINKMFKL